MNSYRKWTCMMRELIEDSRRPGCEGSAVQFDNIRDALIERLRCPEMQVIIHRIRESCGTTVDLIEAVVGELFDDNAPDIAPVRRYPKRIGVA